MRLFWIDVLLRVTTGLEMLLLLAGGAIGLMRNPDFGGWANAPRILAPLLLFVLFNLLLAAGLRSLIERVLGQKRVREVFVVFCVLVGALPQLLVVTGVPKSYHTAAAGGELECLVALGRGLADTALGVNRRVMGGAAGVDGGRLFIRALAI